MPEQPVSIDRVIGMKKQGYTNNQIIQMLQRDGYSSQEIFDAINQADMKHSVEAGTSPGITGNASPAIPPPPTPDATPAVPAEEDSASVEEYVEAVIDEKWSSIEKDIKKIVEWKKQSEQTLVQLQQQFADLKDNFDKLHRAVVGKVGEYDKHILDVGAEIKAMEKVFSKVLPLFTENVHELSRITKSMKGGE